MEKEIENNIYVEIKTNLFFFRLLILNLSLESADFFTHDAIAILWVKKYQENRESLQI